MPPMGSPPGGPNAYYGAQGYPPSVMASSPYDQSMQAGYPQQMQGGYAQPSGPPPAPSDPYFDSAGLIASARVATTDDELDESPLEQAFCKAIRNVNLRVDYLNWSILHPKTTLIGAQPAASTIINPPRFVDIPGVGVVPFSDGAPFQRDPTQYFPTNDTYLFTGGTYPVDGTLAKALNTGPISLTSNSGVRGTLSLPLTYGTAELSGFILQNSDSNFKQPHLPGPSLGLLPVVNAMPFRLDGQPSGLMLFFSNGESALFRSFVFGTEANLVMNPLVYKDRGLIVMPLVGARFLGIQEHFSVAADADTIHSSTINNLIGPQIGTRVEFIFNQWLTIGAEPKIAICANAFASDLSTQFDTSIGRSSDHIDRTVIAPVGALDAYLKIPIHDQVRLYAAYNLIGTGNISRPQDQIAYDVHQNTDGSFSNITHLDIQHNAFLIQGYSVGVEVNF
jgi:hypothetical protein